MQISLALAADQSHLWYTVVQSIVNAVRPLSKWAGWSGGSPAQPSPAQTSPATRPARAPLCQQHARSWPPRQIAAQLFSLTYGVASTRFVMSASAFTSALRNPKVTEEQSRRLLMQRMGACISLGIGLAGILAYFVVHYGIDR